MNQKHMDSFSWDTYVFKKSGECLLLRAKCVLGFIKCRVLRGKKEQKGYTVMSSLSLNRQAHLRSYLLPSIVVLEEIRQSWLITTSHAW